MTINKIKSINKLDIELPIDKGIYAITGQNGSGKSTLVTCASSVFFNMPMNDYFGQTEQDSFIKFELNGGFREWVKNHNDRWVKNSSGSRMNIKGFYEGSLIFGNRFRNTNYQILKRLDKIDNRKLKPVSSFIRENLGFILQNDSNFYEALFKLNNRDAGHQVSFTGDIFYYKKGTKRVSQFHMSTGENLLISVLNSLELRNNDRANLNKPCLLFLDEIELALHPSSLKRLVAFLKEMSKRYNYAIYFSTHSIELIGGIPPQNIFFIERYPDDTVDILNPCYPAYATRILYDHSGYDNVILVEDDLAKGIIDRIIRKKRLLTNRLVHVLPCGGYSNVISLAQEVVTSKLVTKKSSIAIILDGDVEQDAKNYIAKNDIKNNIPINFLPIPSLEKFLKEKLLINVNPKYFRFLNDFIFHQVSLSEIISQYKSEVNVEKDKDGKKLFKRLESELVNRGKSRNDLIEMTLDFLEENNIVNLNKLENFLKQQLK